jgi:hypothetical protein
MYPCPETIDVVQEAGSVQEGQATQQSTAKPRPAEVLASLLIRAARLEHNPVRRSGFFGGTGLSGFTGLGADGFGGQGQMSGWLDAFSGANFGADNSEVRFLLAGSEVWWGYGTRNGGESLVDSDGNPIIDVDSDGIPIDENPLSTFTNGGARADFDTFVDSITSTIQLGSWAEDNYDSIDPFPTNLGLIISQSQELHDQSAPIPFPSGWYSNDDVQYFPPGSEFKLYREAAAMREHLAGQTLYGAFPPSYWYDERLLPLESHVGQRTNARTQQFTSPTSNIDLPTIDRQFEMVHQRLMQKKTEPLLKENSSGTSRT